MTFQKKIRFYGTLRDFLSEVCISFEWGVLMFCSFRVWQKYHVFKPTKYKNFPFEMLDVFPLSPIFCDFALFSSFFVVLVHGYGHSYVDILIQICWLHLSISFFLAALLTDNLVSSVNAEMCIHSRHASMQINFMICVSSDCQYDAIFGDLICWNRCCYY